MWFRETEKEDDKLARNLNRIVDDLADRKTLRRYLAVLCVSNLALWLAVIAFPSLIQYGFGLLSRASDKLSVASLGIPFGLGFFITYSILRLKFPDIEEQDLESLPMGSQLSKQIDEALAGLARVGRRRRRQSSVNGNCRYLSCVRRLILVIFWSAK